MSWWHDKGSHFWSFLFQVVVCSVRHNDYHKPWNMQIRIMQIEFIAAADAAVVNLWPLNAIQFNTNSFAINENW